MQGNNFALNEKCLSKINVNVLLLSAKTRIWMNSASAEEISKIIEIGYMMNYNINKDVMTMDVVANTTLECKNEIEEIKRSMDRSQTKMSDIQSAVTDMIVKTQDKMTDFFTRSSDLFTKSQSTLTSEITKSQATLTSEITKSQLALMESKTNVKSTELGKEGESEAKEILSAHFDVVDMHGVAHNGDYVVNDVVLVEIKNYARNIPTKEVEKFKKDLQTTGKLGGVFWSLNTSIANIGDMKHTTHMIGGKEIPVIYVNTKNKDLIVLACKLILMEIKSKTPIKSDITELDVVLTKRKLDLVNGKMKELEQNMKTILTIRNMLNKLSETFNKSTNEMLLELSVLEGTLKTNIGIIMNDLN
jgi:hypothetical protein